MPLLLISSCGKKNETNPVKANVNLTVSTFAVTGLGPSGLAFDKSGNLYVSEFGGNVIDKLSPSGVLTTFATGFNEPLGLAFDESGNLYVADYGNNLIRKINTSGVVTTFASIIYPKALVFDASGNLYVATSYVDEFRKISPSGVVTIFSGSDSCSSMACNIPTFNDIPPVITIGDSAFKELNNLIILPAIER